MHQLLLELGENVTRQCLIEKGGIQQGLAPAVCVEATEGSSLNDRASGAGRVDGFSMQIAMLFSHQVCACRCRLLAMRSESLLLLAFALLDRIYPYICRRLTDHWLTGGHLLFALVKDIGQVAAAAVLSVVHGSHEDTGTALWLWALSSQSLDLSIAVDLVVLQHGQLGLLALVLDLLGCGVDLLLALLGTTSEAEDEVKRRLLLDVVVGESATVLELLAGEDQALLVRWDSLLVWRVMSVSRSIDAHKTTYLES